MIEYAAPEFISIRSFKGAARDLFKLMGKYELQRDIENDFGDPVYPVYKKINECNGGPFYIFKNGKFICLFVYKLKKKNLSYSIYTLDGRR